MKKLISAIVILLFIGLAFAPSINANINSIIIEPIADLNCEGTLTWKYPEPGEIYTGHFIVQNIGEPESLLDWEIYNWPVWGTWTFNPSSWDDQKPEDGQVIVEVSVIWPDEINDPGQILIINSNNFEDICEIDICISPKCDTNIVDDNFVEFTTEVCGLNGGKQTVKLTQQQADEVEELFDSIREKLNNSKSREEAEVIFKDAVAQLHKFGLLGGLSVKQAQRLVTCGYDNPRLMKLYELLQKRLPQSLDENENLFCLIAGMINGIELNFFSLPYVFFTILPEIAFYVFWFLGEALDGIVMYILFFFACIPFVLAFSLIDNLNPFCFSRTIATELYSGYLKGYFASYGTNGLKIRKNQIKGGINFSPYIYNWHILAQGFYGIKIIFPRILKNELYTFFLGFAIRASVKEKN